MRSSFGIVCGVLALLSGATSAEAAPMRVPAGVAAPVFRMGVYDPRTCTYGALPTLTIHERPAHGTATVERATWAIRAVNVCDGRPITGMQILYRPQPGFHGTDRLSVETTWESVVNGVDKAGQTSIVDIEVK